MNDNERRMWILNDEGMYNWFRSSRQSITKFMQENRSEIDLALQPHAKN